LEIWVFSSYLLNFGISTKSAKWKGLIKYHNRSSRTHTNYASLAIWEALVCFNLSLVLISSLYHRSN
jgi:hypothetical protein